MTPSSRTGPTRAPERRGARPANTSPPSAQAAAIAALLLLDGRESGARAVCAPTDAWICPERACRPAGLDVCLHTKAESPRKGARRIARRSSPLLRRTTGPAGIPCASESVASARCSRFGCLCSLGAGVDGRRASSTSLLLPGRQNERVSLVVPPETPRRSGGPGGPSTSRGAGCAVGGAASPAPTRPARWPATPFRRPPGSPTAPGR